MSSKSKSLTLVSDDELRNQDIKEALRLLLVSVDPSRLVQEIDGKLQVRNFADPPKIARPPRIVSPRIRQTPGQTPRLYLPSQAKVLAGGSGLIVQCRDTLLDDRPHALKILRPSVLLKDSKKQQDILKLQAEELQKAVTLGHRNVALVLDVGTISLEIAEGKLELSHEETPELLVPVFLTEWIEGARGLGDYIWKECGSFQEVVDLFEQALEGLAHVHSRYVHWDVKDGNCLVSAEGVVKVSDLGNAQAVSSKDYAVGEVRISSYYNLPVVLQRADPGDNLSRVELRFVEPGCNFDRPWLDLYMFGKMIARILGLHPIDDVIKREDRIKREKARAKFLEQAFPIGDAEAMHAFRFLHLIIKRLMIEPSLTEQDEHRYYRSAEDVLKDVRKLTPEFGVANSLEELRAISQHVVRLAVTGNVPLTKRLRPLFGASPLLRLKMHHQLGLTHFVYPSAEHSREEHTQGVVGSTISYVKALYADRGAPVFRLLANEEDIKCLLMAAACHDIGQGAFTHYIEEMKPLVAGKTHEDYAMSVLQGQKPLNVGAEAQASWQRDRDALLEVVSEEPTWCKKGEAQAFLNRAASLLNPRATNLVGAKIRSRESAREVLTGILRSVLDSPIDADKMDYLQRDGAHAGLPYANGIDRDRFLQSLTCVAPEGLFRLQSEKDPPDVVDKEDKPTIAISPKGMLPVESMLVARRQLYESLYWQHTARAMTVLIQHLAWEYITATGEAERDQRVGQLLYQMREKQDDDALNWLLEQTQAPGLEWIGVALKERRNLPKKVCEFGHAEAKDDHRALKILLGAHAWLNGDPLPFEKPLPFDGASTAECPSAAEYVVLRNRIVEEFCKEVAGMVGVSATVDRHRLFFDIPLTSKGQSAGIKVLLTAERRDSASHETIMRDEVKEFSDYSPMETAIENAFKLWARPVRVFASVELAKVLSGTDQNELQITTKLFGLLSNTYQRVINDHIKGRQEMIGMRGTIPPAG